jgi:hypothetical protein
MCYQLCLIRLRGTVFSQLPSAVTSTVDHPFGSPSLSYDTED